MTRAQIILLACVLAIGLLAMVVYAPKASAHDIYHDWKTEGGASCCHNKDCAPAIAWRDMNGAWTARQNGRDWIIPPYAVRPYQSPDGRSHLCVIGEAVMCFVPGEVRG